MKILHVLAPAPVGGLETVVASLSKGQATTGHSVTVVPVLDEGCMGHPFLEMMDGGGVDVLPLVVAPRRYLRERRGVRKVLESYRPDVLHTHGYRVDVLDGPVGRRAGVPTLSTVHGFTAVGFKNGFKNGLYEWLQRRAFKSLAAVVAVSSPIVRDLIGFGVDPSRIHLIRNGLPLPSDGADRGRLSRSEARGKLGIPPDIPLVGWIGRLTPEKAPELMVRAFAALPREEPQLSLIGGGWQEEGIRELAGSLGIGGRVHLHGIVQDAGRYLAAFDLLAMSSKTEGTPMVLLEAMASRTPIVTTNVGGIPDILSPEEAVLVPAGDAGAFGEALDRVLAAPEGARSRAEAAFRRVSGEFGLESWIKKYDEVYHTLRSS